MRPTSLPKGNCTKRRWPGRGWSVGSIALSLLRIRPCTPCTPSSIRCVHSRLARSGTGGNAAPLETPKTGAFTVSSKTRSWRVAASRKSARNSQVGLMPSARPFGGVDLNANVVESMPREVWRANGGTDGPIPSKMPWPVPFHPVRSPPPRQTEP